MNTGPVQPIPSDDASRPPEPTAALCLFAEGYHAMALINADYAVCDAAPRKHLQSDLQPKPVFPYPQSGV